MNDYSFFENVRTLFTNVVDMMDSVNVPGIPVTFWDLTAGFFMTACALKLLGLFMGIGIGGSLFNAANGISNAGRRVGGSIGGIYENRTRKEAKESKNFTGKRAASRGQYVIGNRGY